MTAFAYITDDFLKQSVKVLIGWKEGNYRSVINPTGVGQVKRFDTGPGVNADTDVEDYILQIPEDVARALLESLMRYFHGAEDTRALRKDYDAERARVDRLIGLVGKSA